MANVIDQQKLIDNNKRALIKYTATLDTASANSVLLDASTLAYALNTSGKIMTGGVDKKTNYRTSIKRIFGTSKANTYVKLQWQGDTNSSIVILQSGGFDYDFQSMGDGATIANPEANATGNILMTVVTPASTDSLTLFIDLRKDSRDYDAGQTADPVAFNLGPAAP